MDNEKIVAKARLAADFMSNLSEDIVTREDLTRYCPWCGAEVVDDEQT